MKQKIVYLDCDGTVMTFNWPKNGVPNLRWKPVLRRLIAVGYEIIVNTARVHDMRHGSLQKAHIWFLEQFPEYDFKFTTEKLDPLPWDLSGDNNILYIDDLAPNIPLMKDSSSRPLVHWGDVRKELEKENII